MHAWKRFRDSLQDESHSQVELAATNRTSEQSMGRTIDGLERRGLVARRKHPSDRRRVVVSLTANGEDTLRAALHGTEGAVSVFDQLPDEARLRKDLVLLVELLGSQQ